jgi:hypothetical protein
MGIFKRLFQPRTFAMSEADSRMWATSRREGIQNTCGCFVMSGEVIAPQQTPVQFHADKQDTSSPAWAMLEALIENAAAKRQTEFAPGLEMPAEYWEQIVILPTSIAKLSHVKKLYLYGSYLVRIPPEIGAMAALEELDLYSSYRLHWLPFEITRCAKVKQSRVSTRALYGSYKYRAPFPELNDAAKGLAPGACSVCAKAIDQSEVRQMWISLRVATDVLPLLVNACSDECIGRLPEPAKGYVEQPHKGGVELVQPEPTFHRPR